MTTQEENSTPKTSLFSRSLHRIGQFFVGFWDFLKNVLLLFRRDYIETTLFILFCTIFTAVTTSVLKELLIKAIEEFTNATDTARSNYDRCEQNVGSIVSSLRV